MVFERKVLRKIFCPTKERYGTWRIKSNDEFFFVSFYCTTSLITDYKYTYVTY